jgi:hypothetical protein
MQRIREVQDYLEDVLDRLEDSRYSCEQNVPFEGKTFWWVAHRTQYLGLRKGYRELFFHFTGFSRLDEDLLEEYCGLCFDHSCRAKRTSFPVGWYLQMWSFAVALVDRLDDDLLDFVRNHTPKAHWNSCEMPCVYEAATDELHYFERTPMWGALYYPYRRSLIKSLLAP